jgi:hypothetical protein
MIYSTVVLCVKISCHLAIMIFIFLLKQPIAIICDGMPNVRDRDAYILFFLFYLQWDERYPDFNQSHLRLGIVVVYEIVYGYKTYHGNG